MKLFIVEQYNLHITLNVLEHFPTNDYRVNLFSFIYHAKCSAKSYLLQLKAAHLRYINMKVTDILTLSI